MLLMVLMATMRSCWQTPRLHVAFEPGVGLPHDQAVDLVREAEVPHQQLARVAYRICTPRICLKIFGLSSQHGDATLGGLLS